MKKDIFDFIKDVMFCVIFVFAGFTAFYAHTKIEDMQLQITALKEHMMDMES